MKEDDFDFDKTDLISTIISIIFILGIMTIILMVSTVYLVPAMNNLYEEVTYIDSLTPEEYEQYVKQNKQTMYEERMQVYVDEETGIEYLIYKDSGMFGNDVMVVRYDENGNVKTNSTYLTE